MQVLDSCIVLRFLAGAKTADTKILSGYQIYHNYFRLHEALKGNTPAEKCGIQIEGENKWQLHNKLVLSEYKMLQEPHSKGRIGRYYTIDSAKLSQALDAVQKLVNSMKRS